jgi:hypothetical protein
MPSNSANLRLVVSDTDTSHRDNAARRFRDAMTAHIQAHTEGTSVNPETLLTTDYLNHYNEVIALLEQLPTAPAELAADLAAWRHETYPEHFEQSDAPDKALALAGYKRAPVEIRDAFDAASDDLSKRLVDVLTDVQSKLQAKDHAGMQDLCESVLPEIQDQVEQLASIINGET